MYVFKNIKSHDFISKQFWVKFVLRRDIAILHCANSRILYLTLKVQSIVKVFLHILILSNLHRIIQNFVLITVSEEDTVQMRQKPKIHSFYSIYKDTSLQGSEWNRISQAEESEYYGIMNISACFFILK